MSARERRVIVDAIVKRTAPFRSIDSVARGRYVAAEILQADFDVLVGLARAGDAVPPSVTLLLSQRQFETEK